MEQGQLIWRRARGGQPLSCSVRVREGEARVELPYRTAVAPAISLPPRASWNSRKTPKSLKDTEAQAHELLHVMEKRGLVPSNQTQLRQPAKSRSTGSRPLCAHVLAPCCRPSGRSCSWYGMWSGDVASVMLNLD